MISLNRYYTLYFKEAKTVTEQLMQLNLVDKMQKLHSLKGTAKALQLTSQVKLLFEMEELAKSGETQKLQKHLEVFQEELQRWKQTFKFDDAESFDLMDFGSPLESLLREK